jgi:hypothetical protein
MARIRSQNELILSILEFFRTAQPNLDTKPGTVSRDLMVDSQAAQISRLYQELDRISTLQSLRLALGSDLDKLSANYGATRKLGTKSSGTAILTFSSIETDVPINRGQTVTARNGATFVINSGFVVSQVYSNTYRAIASQYKPELELAGITDEYAVEVLVEATTSGIQGNISKYNLNTANIEGVSNVTNVTSFSGGTLAEDDASFRSRVLAIFSGANTGTELGYQNAVLEDPAALDAIVISPGDDLMTRDGTQVYVDPETGDRTVISEGTGGRVDIYVFGTRLQEIIESYIFVDKSNTGDPANVANDFVLGQIEADEGKTVTKKRLDNLESGTLPSQPVNNIISVSGSVSGANFIPKNIDSLGITTGNYELVKDEGVYGGSPWGFDKLRWISDRISDLLEDKTKGTNNGQDGLSFSDVTEINAGSQNINVVNENSRVNRLNRSSIQLAHYPITNVTRVLNATTGERYVITSQNPDGTGSQNETGRITISGSTLPGVSDILQVDYTWIKDFDPYIDFDGQISNINPNPRDVTDSVDWGYSNAVRREEVTLIANGDVLTATVTHPISSVVSVNVVEREESAQVTKVNGRDAVIVSETVTNVVSIIRDDDLADLWNTSQENGSFTGTTIFIPTDAPRLGIDDDIVGDNVSVTYNAQDVYNVDGYEGSYSNNVITIVPTSTAVAGLVVEVNYIANINTLVSATVMSSLPLVRNGNRFDSVTTESIGTQPTTHKFLPESSPFGNPVWEPAQNLRQAPSVLGLNISGSVSPGVITTTGTTFFKVAEAVFTHGAGAFGNQLRIQLSEPIKDDLGLTSAESVPSNLKLARVVSVEKVQATTSFEVLSVDHTYDIKSYQLRDNSFFKSESVKQDSTSVNLSNTEFILPNTVDNTANAPQTGDKLRVTFYYILENDTENVHFSKSGTLFTNKEFAIVNTLAVSSGFTSVPSQSATLTITNLNQPNTGSRYQSTYDYLSPKSNERISIRFNLNKLIPDATLLVENTRPITADVLTKESTAIGIDTTMNIVLFPEFVNNSTTVQQNVQDAIVNALNATSLGTTVDSSDLVVVAQSVEGVDRARVLFFNEKDESGSVLSISAQKNEYLQANEVIINIETR